VLVHAAVIGAPRKRIAAALEAAVEALRSDRVRTRSAIVALGIAMAIVVCLTTLVERSRAATIRSLERAGLTNVYLVNRPAQEAHDGSPGRLTFADVERARGLLPVRSAVAIRIQHKTIEANGKPFTAPVYAFSGPLAETFGARCRAGRFLGDLDVDRKLPYCLVGSDVKSLARWTGTVGQILSIGGRSYQIVGELAESAGENASVGDIPSVEWNRAIVVPLGTEPEAARETDQRYPIDVAVLRFATVARANAGADLLQRALRSRPGREEAMRVASPIQTLRQYKQTRQTFDRLIWLVCLLTAASAVFGISNQLSASVIARTREIGVRRAVGARSIDIVLQFQAEGLLLGILGGGAGLFVGWIVSLVAMDRAGGWSLSLLSFSALALGCVVLGILTGIRPSIRASRIDPAAALREG
jgi:putative ABC transport system permease protein